MKAYISFVIVCYPLSALQAALAAYVLGQSLRDSTTNVIRGTSDHFPATPSLSTPHTSEVVECEPFIIHLLALNLSASYVEYNGRRQSGPFGLP